MKRLHLMCLMVMLGIGFWAGQSLGATRASEAYVRTFGKQGTLRFEMVDHVKDARFAWPRTLLTYPVRFEGAGVKAEDLRLRDLSDGKAVPFQLSEVKSSGGELTFAVVNFFSDLPSGGARRFELSAGGAGTAAEKPVKVVQEGGVWTVDAGTLQVRLPATQAVAAGAKVPGPILQLNRGLGWMGDSSIIGGKRVVKSLTTEVLENGALFATVRVTYGFEGGGSYAATVKIISGYPLVEFFEEMEGLSKEDGVAMENAWTNYHPTHRWSIGLRAVMPMDKPRIEAFRGEDPAFTGPSQVEDPTKNMHMWMEITPSNGWSGWKEATFWDEKTAVGLGLFIQEVGKWQDHEYSIWVSTETLRPQFRYADGVLYWKWPLVRGTRATGVACYEVPKDAEVTDDGQDPVDRNTQKRNPILEMRSRYGDLSLNRVKDWVLEYPENATKAAPLSVKGRMKDVAAYDKALESCAVMNVAGGMYHPVSLRDMHAWIVPDYSRFAGSMSKEQRERATAIILMAAYCSASEEYGPIRVMLGGHPNFMADYVYPLMGASYLFPDHPMAGEWRDRFEKFMDLSGRFYTRPAVGAWEAKGGRWTESIATYNWAYLSPTSEANRLGMAVDGKNRFATPWLALMGDYLVGVLTAPVTLDAEKKDWPANEALTVENGFKRIHPSQGAHAGKRGIPGTMYSMGQWLTRYSPMVAEHLMWGGAPFAKDAFEDRPAEDVKGEVNRGTNPHLTSAKYTGYGIVMRSAVDTPDEISVYLQQVDKGPNYRWGYGNQNGSGDIYYYAKGKSFSGHGFEDAGDRHSDDAMHTCNTGVYKNYHFYSIGMNELTRPFYNLEVAQFAEIVPQEGPGAYSWPEYRSRSVMLVGSDYIVTYDAINGWSGTRFAWNSAGVHDEMPFIHHIKGGGDNVVDTVSRARDKQKGVLYDVWKGGEDRMMVVTHLGDLKVVPPKKVKNGKKPPYSHISTSTSDDFVFQNSEEIAYADDGMVFRGTAGVIRNRKDKSVELALFHGNRIGSKDLAVSVDDAELGVSLAFKQVSQIKGTYFGRKGGTMTLAFADAAPAKAVLYVDGAAVETKAAGKTLVAKLAGGEHRWELTSQRPEPMSPVMLRTENVGGGAKVFFATVAGAESYRVEVSTDGGKSWQSSGQSKGGEFELKGLTNGTKVHVRAVAVNADQQSRPAREYPVYVTDKAPLPPEGVQTQIGEKQVKVTWGEVLGVSEYRLYRREAGQEPFKEVYRGRSTEFADANVKSVAAFVEPGVAANVLRDRSGYVVYEYAVTAVNGNGEGRKSIVADTEPASWRNWNPATDLRFKRQSGYWLPPYVHAEEVPAKYYP